jgi:hypothetical protein
MVDKSNEYGYIGASPTQAGESNTGVFEVNDIVDLIGLDKWTLQDNLELIETQTYSTAVSSVEFTSIQESTYNVHFLTLNNIKFVSLSNIDTRFSTDGGSSYISATDYEVATLSGQSNGTFSESKSTNNNALSVFGASSTNSQNAYAYYYNLGDSSKYSFQTLHSTIDYNTVFLTRFGSAMLRQANTVNAIQLRSSTGVNFSSFNISLYGIAES